jgi:predicted DNA-binding transcriptional regulator AlpA
MTLRSLHLVSTPRRATWPICFLKLGVTTRQSRSRKVSSAIVSAYVDVTGAGAKVERFEPDYLVSLTDISKRTGLSKAAITHYHKGARAKDFPTPIARVTSESPLWDWHAVAEWMCTNNKVDQNVVIQARVMKEANVVVESIGAPSDAFTRRMRERVLECEPA